MKKFFVSVISALFWVVGTQAQTTQPFRLHSHNDYLQEVPFWAAYSAGASSIEVDVILHRRELMVAHEPESMDSKRTLESLYLDPITEGLENGVISTINFHLLVDLKTAAEPTLEVLMERMKQYSPILFGDTNPNGLKLIISGNRPKPETYSQYPEWMFFDYQSETLNSELPWDKIAMVSLNFRQFSVWNGKGRMVEEERKRVEEFIDLVHSFDKPVRFWASPDSKSAWKAFYEMGEDFINTDRPVQAAEYLGKLNENIYQNTAFHSIYQPTFEWDGADVPVKNVILLIGDGNGLAQLSAGLFSHKNELNVTQLKNIGLIKTQAADDFTTDSAAGATAFATGHKTNNRAIGVDPKGKVLPTLPEFLDSLGFQNGIITTDQLTGATPASFYAHHSERDASEQIAKFLAKSPLDLVIGGGERAFRAEKKNLTDAGFTLVEGLKPIKTDRLGYFAAEGALPKKLEGRGDFLVESTLFALEFFQGKGSPFFLMIESAFIDSGGHSNSTSTLISEMLDFDALLGEVIRFADENPGTLVLITADHETGGVSIPQGDLASHRVELGFHSDDHTGILVPIIAYGSYSDRFRGVYENTEVFRKIVDLVRKE
ncbi:alkaline phosphatase [Algoriphagus sp.]|uniref:alkaline phosphatase n=1 Tax=Algoriphagus sp. TaxID=1872435 RepID=UPI002639E45B|nr:alkaline phosphatase [Algoriphagus sp.]